MKDQRQNFPGCGIRGKISSNKNTRMIMEIPQTTGKTICSLALWSLHKIRCIPKTGSITRHYPNPMMSPKEQKDDKIIIVVNQTAGVIYAFSALQNLWRAKTSNRFLSQKFADQAKKLKIYHNTSLNFHHGSVCIKPTLRELFKPLLPQSS